MQFVGECMVYKKQLVRHLNAWHNPYAWNSTEGLNKIFGRLLVFSVCIVLHNSVSCRLIKRGLLH